MALNINGTTGISGVDGSASAPALQGTDSNTGVSFGSDTVNINTGGTTRATVNSSGKFGINTTNPVGKLTVDENNASEHFQLRNTTNTSNFSAFGVDTSFNLRCYVNQSERMRIDSSGRILFNTNSYSSVGNGSVNASYIYNGSLITSRDNTGNREHAVFHNPNGDVGSINTSGSSTSYTTSSDYRLKENVSYDWDATSRLKQLKPCRFNWISDETNTLVDGFLAHEVSSSVPQAVSGEKDAVDKDGKIKPQGIDQSKIVPLMVKTIQELEARIAKLEAK